MNHASDEQLMRIMMMGGNLPATHHKQPPKVATEQNQVTDLAMLVRRLAYALNKKDPGNRIVALAVAYLHRTGLDGSPLRDVTDEEEIHED